MTMSNGLPDAIRPPDRLIVRSSANRGRGVFAAAPIARGEMIEAAPVIALDQEDRAMIDKTELAGYFFNWQPGHQPGAAIALGYGSLYNHSYTPNSSYTRNFDLRTIDFIALRDIEAGEEITINYNGEPSCRDPLWFEPLD